MNQLKENKGITLIALVVTIIVLLILASIAISLTIGNNGIFTRAKNATKKYEEASKNEQIEMQNGINEIDNYIESNGGKEPPIQEEPVDTVKIPENFHHLEGESREEGIVVADRAGNEYVWIPVTKDEEGNPTDPYKDTNGELNGKVIQLQRNSFEQEGVDVTTMVTEDTAENHNSEYKNAIAYDIDGFKQSVIKNGGYFLGRYEAGIKGGSLDISGMPNESTAPNANWTGYTGGTLVVKKGQQVWSYVTQNKASELCRNIDTEKGYTEVTSDLINSYAWDTAIMFIQACGAESNSSNYAKQSGESTTPEAPSKTGEAILKNTNKEDKQCNIYDMAGSCIEWSTETIRDSISPCAFRGGLYLASGYYITSLRFGNSTTNAYSYFSFRPVLYWNS